MFNLFFEGGWEFMSLITLFAIAMLFFAGKGASDIYGDATSYQSGKLYYIRFFGMLALVAGIFGQLIGLYDAMQAIARMGGVSQEMLAAGFRVSFITTLYGFVIFLIAHLIWFFLDMKGKKAGVAS
ncbi:MotA/TolQ/ExbB proton channel family protein [Nafulsella turpanensis]|uniref:MotA/TolQ/ExbB proton channel family protein n=1 Tax=Nafulsella turpanensis TaxID=1265690 RepID=UPI00034BB9B6|nr:MotA/TolQ/ExbB proton channel family protein [Nafulsella turpanensis]